MQPRSSTRYLRIAGLRISGGCFCIRTKWIEEGFRRVESKITFDYQRGKSVLDHKKHQEKRKQA